MRYHVIKGIANGSLAYAVQENSGAVPVLVPSYSEIFKATLYKHPADAKNALGEMPYRIAVECEIVPFDVNVVANH